MKKKTIIIIAICVAAVILAGILIPVIILGDNSSSSSSSSGSGEKEQIYDPETRPLTMSIGTLDGNFNPFFYTAQNDGNVVNMTQVSLLASDENGEPVVGEDRPTVAKAFTKKSDSEHTTYEFLIKNGMKYSDGNDLTVMDVLFNYYVYLDEAYIGSNTLYSTDIVGLNAYHTQNPLMDDDAENTTYQTFLSDANTRILNVIDYCNNDIDVEDQILKDIVTTVNLFKDEVKSDWTSVENSFASRDQKNYEYRFTEAWEAYLFNEGVVINQTTTLDNGSIVPAKDENGKYLTTLDEDDSYQNELNDYLSEENIKKYTDKGSTREQAIEYLKRDWAIDFVYSAKTGFAGVNADITVESLSDVAWSKFGVIEILSGWATGNTVLEQFISEARTAFYEDKKVDGKLVVPTISGISAYRTNSFDGKELGEDHDVLKIVINGVDPKAIWNFAVTVAPMHYYSTNELVQKANDDYQNYLTAYENGQSYTLTNFGVKFADADFFGEGKNGGLKSGNKGKLPIGAGAYMASTVNGGEGTADGFHSNKFVYYERNPYFHTMGAELDNAIIKSVRYSEIGEDKIITALLNKEIDYGMPSGTADNSALISAGSQYLGSAKYLSNGYGYVGINPKYVPEVELRRAIMMAMDTTATVRNYYTTDWASVIYRPMSKNSWAYPQGVTADPSIDFVEGTPEKIKGLIEDAGYRLNAATNLYEKNGKPLKLTFTIAGSSTDHPAYKMFTDAKTLLEGSCNVQVTVVTDILALKKLAQGELAVWAAAWSSSIDPDMYQVYHKDSKATSVKNWNYPEILNDTTSKFAYEREIIGELSKIIDDAREIDDQNARADMYKDALDLIMDLAVELPTYQRNDYEVYNKEVINSETLTDVPTAFRPLFDRLWEINYN